mmetsp:Transcript_54290/g.126394  ORF Transcript_54290/g.126394 Transcript_54290/m.126394 type:complete len:245 (-) Transcript_54290:14-748(-)
MRQRPLVRGTPSVKQAVLQGHAMPHPPVARARQPEHRFSNVDMQRDWLPSAQSRHRLAPLPGCQGRHWPRPQHHGACSPASRARTPAFALRTLALGPWPARRKAQSSWQASLAHTVQQLQQRAQASPVLSSTLQPHPSALAMLDQQQSLRYATQPPLPTAVLFQRSQTEIAGNWQWLIHAKRRRLREPEARHTKRAAQPGRSAQRPFAAPTQREHTRHSGAGWSLHAWRCAVFWHRTRQRRLRR